MTDKPQWPTFKANESLIDQLIKLSQYYGSDPQFVLAGGGNTSAKTDDRLYVKGSGHALATIGPEGFVEMNRAPVHDLLETQVDDNVERREAYFKDQIMAARVHPEKQQRPSVECVLHNLLPGRFVVHTHSTQINMLTCCVNGRELVEKHLGDRALWIPFVDPGFVLAQRLDEEMKAYVKRTDRQCPEAIIMQNHGLIVCGETPDEIHERTDAILATIDTLLRTEAATATPFGATHRCDDGRACRVRQVVSPALRVLLGAVERPKIVTFDDSDTVMQLAGAAGGRDVVASGPLTPDQIVYCRSFPLWLTIDDGASDEQIIEQLRTAIGDHQQRTGSIPYVVLVEGVGMWTMGDTFKDADTVRAVYADAIEVMAGAQRLGGINYLSVRDREFIENWEVEAYRRQIAARAAGQGRISGKVAVVTGAAQGFGLEIAEDLVAQGAHVAMLDINEQAVSEQANRLCEHAGKGRAVGLSVNVTDTDTIADGIDRIVRTYGGFDVFVSNAGVLRAESVKTQSERDFDFVTDVNYKGFFLCVQQAVPVLATQHKANPEYTSDIIQINSKSGLTGSNRNGAYAGSKFGGLGLVQSYALELIEDGIKVNAICPGNFFDGPLWSDPDNGLFVQYLRANKVPGAKTIDDVRKAYESKVPMGRGCKTADVMTAMYYIIEQQYETGQAVPVTGGQVMLS